MKGRAQRKGEKPAIERRRYPIGVDPRKVRRQERAAARAAKAKEA